MATVQQIPWTAAHEKLLTAFVGRSTPDLAQVGNTWVPELVALGAVEPLDAFLAGSSVVSPADHFPGVWDTNVIDGKVWGIPWYVDTRLLFYRRDLLAEVGWNRPPATWHEAMRQLKAHAGRDRWAIILPTDEWPQPVILGMELGAELVRDGRWGAFSDRRFAAGFDFYLGMFREGLAPVLGSAQIASLYQQFADGTFAMIITGPWNVGEMRRRLPADFEDHWATAPMPAPAGDGPGVSLAGGSSLVIFRSSAHKRQAWRIIERLSEPEAQVRFFTVTGDLPANTSAWRAPVVANDPKLAAFFTQLGNVRATPKVPEWEQIATKVFEAVQRAVYGGSTLEATLAGLDADVDRILSKRRAMLDAHVGGS
jgi:multiple sugar transport system substrate-binding protein